MTATVLEYKPIKISPPTLAAIAAVEDVSDEGVPLQKGLCLPDS
jgi:hypothetical protein